MSVEGYIWSREFYERWLVWKKVKDKSRGRVRLAVLSGKLINLKTTIVKCVDCKTERATQYEHRDYRKPLEVDAVCRDCNRDRGPAKDTPPEFLI